MLTFLRLHINRLDVAQRYYLASQFEIRILVDLCGILLWLHWELRRLVAVLARAIPKEETSIALVGIIALLLL